MNHENGYIPTIKKFFFGKDLTTKKKADILVTQSMTTRPKVKKYLTKRESRDRLKASLKS